MKIWLRSELLREADVRKYRCRKTLSYEEDGIYACRLKRGHREECQPKWKLFGRVGKNPTRAVGL